MVKKCRIHAPKSLYKDLFEIIIKHRWVIAK